MTELFVGVINDDRRIRIPQRLLNILGMQIGDYVSVFVEDGRVTSVINGPAKVGGLEATEAWMDEADAA